MRSDVCMIFGNFLELNSFLNYFCTDALNVVDVVAAPLIILPLTTVAGLFVPKKTFHSQERKVPMENFLSRDLSFPGTFVPWTLCSL